MASQVRRFSIGSAMKDLGAGLVHGLVSVPDGLASGLLAGLAPISGLYGYLAGTLAGAVSTSSVFMSVQGTGAMAVIIADIPELHGASDATVALATLGAMTGTIMLVLGLLKLGSLVRFVPNAVLTGFINAVSVNIVLGQFAGFTGYTSDAPNRFIRAIATLGHVSDFHWPTLVIGASTILLVLVLEKTPLRSLSLFVAIAVTSAIVALIPLETVDQVRSVAAIPNGLPLPIFPSPGMVFPLLIPALSLAFVGLVQGAAISQSIPNPDGNYPDVSGDFRGQGIANIVSGFFQGTPVGGSMSATGLLTAAGARSRLANITAAAVMIVVILFFSSIAGYIAMPALAGLLMLVGFRMFNFTQLVMVWKTGATQASVMIVTFVLTLVIPLQYAVLIGVGLSVILFVARQSNHIKVVRWTFPSKALLAHEEPPPAELPKSEIVVLAIYGSLFFASAPIFVAQLPTVTPKSSGSVVVLRLRGKEDLGSTIILAISRYQEELMAAGSFLVITGVGQRLIAQLRATKSETLWGADNIFEATGWVGQSLSRGLDRARRLVSSDSAPNPTV